MNTSFRFPGKFYYKEICRGVIGRNKHLTISVRSDDKVSIAQGVHVDTDEGAIDSRFKNAIAIFPDKLMMMLHLLIYIVLRLSEEHIPVEDRHFVILLRQISIESQKRLVSHMNQLGYPPANYNGQKYAEYRQIETGNEIR